MNEHDFRDEADNALRLARRQRVIYLEGKTDPPIFFALLGVQRPPDDLYHGVLVKGLGARGSGSSAVAGRLELAKRYGYEGKFFGIVDGDGLELSVLEQSFEAPYAGPLFKWKAYCIENLLVKAGWPPSWGDEPLWPKAMAHYAPYSALNRLRQGLVARLSTLGLERFKNPITGQSPPSATEVEQALERDKSLITSFDVAKEFRTEMTAIEVAISQGIDGGHALINGKWFVDVLAPQYTRLTPQECRDEWANYVGTLGGLAEVRDLWRRIIGIVL